MAPIDLYHVVGIASNIKALRFFLALEMPINVMIAASAYEWESRYQKNTGLIRAAVQNLIVDSGFLGMAKKGNAAWANQHAKVITIGKALGADRIAMLDIPMEPQILANVGFSQEDAMATTLRNAGAMLEETRIKPSQKLFVIQGWEDNQYLQCIKNYQDLGIFDNPHHWIGIGSVCLRKPNTGLFRIAKLVCENLPQPLHIHCFGIARPDWVRELARLGVGSCDSASAAMNNIAPGLYIGDDFVSFRGEYAPRDEFMSALEFARNCRALDLAVAQEQLYPEKWAKFYQANLGTQLQLDLYAGKRVFSVNEEI